MRKDIIAPFGYTGTCDSRLFMKWIQEMLVPNLKKNQIVIMDNATIHKSPKIKEAIEKAGCKLGDFHPYSPDLNPIERFWFHLKLKIESSKQKFDSLFDAMQYVLANCSPPYLRIFLERSFIIIEIPHFRVKDDQ